MARRTGPRPSLATRAEQIDREAVVTRARTGKGHRCAAAFCDAEATRWFGVWRCDTCPPPAPLTISADIDPSGRDKHKRHLWSTYGVSRTAREHDGRDGEPRQ